MKGRSFGLHLLHPVSWTRSSHLARVMSLRICPLSWLRWRQRLLGYLPPFSLRNIKALEVLSFPILLKTEGHCRGVNGYNLSNTNYFELYVALSPLSFSASSAMMYYVWLIIFTPSWNFHHRPGWYIGKANPWCRESAILSQYHFLRDIRPIRLCFNDMP